MDFNLQELQVDLLRISAKETLEGLNSNTDYKSVRQKAFEALLDNGEIVHVQVIATRDEHDFIGDFATEAVV